VTTTSNWAGKTVFITGVCGTVGRELLRKVCATGIRGVVGIDTNETELFLLREELRGDERLQLFLCDIRQSEQIVRRMAGADIVLHAAAYKHVDMCERAPQEAILTNIIGTQNVIDASFANKVERAILTSSDKAVNPTSVMGTSKLMGERLIAAASAQCRSGDPVFASIRFGNVLGSRGSVIPIFRRQIESGHDLTLTDVKMTRFIMTLDQAAHLVMDAVFLARGGEVIVTKMPVLRIEDLAGVMIEELAPAYHRDPASIAIRVIGAKPGEKMYEELTNDEEVRRTFDWDRYLIVKPAFTGDGLDRFGDLERTGSPIAQPYNSALATAMSKEGVRAFVRAADLV
jgi:FlaA1/EpsC-like NDP-sugar epimerase